MIKQLNKHFLAALLSLGSAQASIMFVPTSAQLAPNGSTDYLSGTPAGSNLVAPSNLGFNVTLIPPAGVGLVQIVPANSSTGFAAGTVIYDNQFTGPLTIGFGQNVYGAGLFIASAFGPSFTGKISAFRSDNTQIGSTFSLASNPPSPLYIGVLDTLPEIAKIVIGDSAGPGDNYFYVTNVDLRSTSASAPEPSTLALGVPVLLALWRARRPK